MSNQTELRNLIIKAKQAYYYGSKPIMSDSEYDSLEDELRLIDPNDPVLSIVGAPIPPDSILTKAKHSIPMGSQSKINSVDEFLTWYDKNVGNSLIHVSLKGDGASAAAYYDNGKLKQVISRGDGTIGEDITSNAVKFKGLPVYVPGFTGAVRFEVILTVKDWGAVDPNRSTNPRNTGTGIMGRKNGQDSERLTVFAFDINETINGAPFIYKTEQEKSEKICELGFNSIPYKMCKNKDEVIVYFNKITSERDSLPFWIDGIMVKINEITIQNQLGIVSGRPKGQVAWKFDSEGAETILKSLSISGGHTGALIPNAQFEPIQIGGTTVKNASLSNWDEVERLNLSIGDHIWVIKANDIIPKIVRVTNKMGDGKKIVPPEKCPFCNGSVGRRRNTGGMEGAIIECQNEDCPKKSSGKIKRWITSLDIMGIGGAVLNAMIEQLDMEDVSDLYKLHKDPQKLAEIIINCEKDLHLGDKRASNILESIEANRKLTLMQFLGSLGIEHLGKRRVEMIVQAASGRLNTLKAWRSGILRDPDLAQQAGVPSIGNSIQERIDSMSGLIDKLLDSGVSIEDAKNHVPEQNQSVESTKTICITGKLPSGKKKSDYANLLKESGYRLVDKVSKDLDILVLAEPNSTSSKAQKARNYGIRLIGEEELLRIVGKE